MASPCRRRLNRRRRPETVTLCRGGVSEGWFFAGGNMKTADWRQGEAYRCLNSQCECELVITHLPRPGRDPISLPSCCACGAPMELAQGEGGERSRG